MLMSPIAMKEKWRDKANSSQGESLHFPINAVRYMLASKLDFVSDFEDVWDAALIETTSDVSLPYLSKMEGGYLDTVEGQQVAFSPRNAFFVSFKPTILGVSFPANRQDLGRWLRKIKRHDEPQVSEYLQTCRSAGAWQGSHRRRPSTSETCSRAARCATGCIARRALRARRSISTCSPRCSHRSRA